MVHQGRIDSGLCTLFLPHTSAGLIVQEKADPSARKDLENWLNRLVPEEDALYTHVAEGTDDMPAHVKSLEKRERWRAIDAKDRCAFFSGISKIQQRLTESSGILRNLVEFFVCFLPFAGLPFSHCWGKICPRMLRRWPASQRF